MTLRGAAAITGLGELTAAVASPGRTTLDLLAEAATSAIADAGLRPHEVDGLLVPPVTGLPLIPAAAVTEHLGLRVGFAELVDLGGATAAGMIWRAAAAIHGGLCSVCLCVTGLSSRTRPTGKTAGQRAYAGAASDRSSSAEFEAPYGLVGANAGYALIAARYEHEYGPTSSARAKIAVEQRHNGLRNPLAALYDQPLSAADVLGSEVICDPLHKLEIVRRVAGAAAVIVAAGDRALSGPHRPVWLLGAGEAVAHSSLTSAESLTQTNIGTAASRAFAMAGTTPADIGLASLYDCYTIAVLLTLEDAGFCEKGAGASFVESHDLTWSGDFPLNTHGGQLSCGQAGTAGGMTHITEAVRQMQGRANGRQLPDLRLAYVHGNGGIMTEQVGLVLGATP